MQLREFLGAGVTIEPLRHFMSTKNYIILRVSLNYRNFEGIMLVKERFLSYGLAGMIHTTPLIFHRISFLYVLIS